VVSVIVDSVPLRHKKREIMMEMIVRVAVDAFVSIICYRRNTEK
jgi:hypothetical protein